MSAYIHASLNRSKWHASCSSFLLWRSVLRSDLPVRLTDYAAYAEALEYSALGFNKNAGYKTY